MFDMKKLADMIRETSSGKYEGGHLVTLDVTGQPRKVTVFMTNNDATVDNLKRMLSAMGCEVKDDE